MYIGMHLNEFKREWLAHFATNVSKNDIEDKALKQGNYIWHIFSWKLIDLKDYLTGEKAREAFNNVNRQNAWYINPWGRITTVRTFDSAKITAEELENEDEIYVVANDLSWTYIKTHENDMCGPYFYKK